MISFIRSKMFTPAFKFFAALAMASLVAAFASAITTNDDPWMDRLLGPITLGWKGGVGNHLYYVMFVGLAIVSATLAIVSVAFRDTDPKAQKELTGSDTLARPRTQPGGTVLGIASVIAIGAVIYGQISMRWVTPAGLALMGLVAIGWTLQTVRSDAASDQS